MASPLTVSAIVPWCQQGFWSRIVCLLYP